MRPTLGLTGMDPATESALQAAFAVANANVGGHWRLLPDAEADYVVVDMDSMYGPMSWLRLHGAGKTVIGLTSASRVQTEFRLGKPFGGNDLRALLLQLETGKPDARLAAAPVVETAPPEPIVESVVEEIATPPAAEPAPAEAALDALPVAPEPIEQPSVPAPPAAPAEKTLGDWLAPGALTGLVRFERGPVALLIDADRRQYHGPAVLKPLAALFEGVVLESAFAKVERQEWESQAATAGGAQPLSRLVWLGALVAGRGRIAAGFDDAARYQLLKWPQTEREYPKHFRIATAMMKGPATLPEIAEGSGVGLDEVTDFVNANLATGFAEPFREPEPEVDPPKPSGLFGRLRGR